MAPGATADVAPAVQTAPLSGMMPVGAGGYSPIGLVGDRMGWAPLGSGPSCDRRLITICEAWL